MVLILYSFNALTLVGLPMSRSINAGRQSVVEHCNWLYPIKATKYIYYRLQDYNAIIAYTSIMILPINDDLRYIRVCTTDFYKALISPIIVSKP